MEKNQESTNDIYSVSNKHGKLASLMLFRLQTNLLHITSPAYKTSATSPVGDTNLFILDMYTHMEEHRYLSNIGFPSDR